MVVSYLSRLGFNMFNTFHFAETLSVKIRYLFCLKVLPLLKHRVEYRKKSRVPILQLPIINGMTLGRSPNMWVLCCISSLQIHSLPIFSTHTLNLASQEIDLMNDINELAVTNGRHQQETQRTLGE